MTTDQSTIFDLVEGDDAVSLRAALSMLDDWDFDFGSLFESDDTRTQNEMDGAQTSVASSSASAAGKCAVPEAPYRGHNRRKLEIQCLRDQAEKLERELARARRAAEAIAAVRATVESEESKQLAAVWEELDYNQRAQLETATKENHELRDLLGMQVNFARQLLHTSRQVHVDKALLPTTPLRAFDFDRQMLKVSEHLRELDKLHTQTPGVFDKPSFNSGTRQWEEIRVIDDEAHGITVEFDIAAVFPFADDHVADALWHHTVRMPSNERVHQFKDVDVQPSSIVSMFRSVSNAMLFENCLQGQIGTRRYTCDSGCEIVSKVYGEIVVRADVSFEMQGEGWLRCSPIHNGLRRTNDHEDMTSPLTQVYWYRRIRVVWGSTTAPLIGMLSSHEIAARVRATVAWNLQSVENQLLMRRKRLTSIYPPNALVEASKTGVSKQRTPKSWFRSDERL